MQIQGATAEQLAAVWDRPVGEIRQRMESLFTQDDVDRFAVWLFAAGPTLSLMGRLDESEDDNN